MGVPDTVDDEGGRKRDSTAPLQVSMVVGPRNPEVSGDMLGMLRQPLRVELGNAAEWLNLDCDAFPLLVVAPRTRNAAVPNHDSFDEARLSPHRLVVLVRNQPALVLVRQHQRIETVK
jgi:hypothetical protein